MIEAMVIKIAENREEWDSWLLRQENFEFLQSWDWGEFQKKTGKEVLRLQYVEDGQIKAQMQGFFHPLKKDWQYWYAPRMQGTKKGVEALAHYLKNKKNIFIRIEPQAEICFMHTVSRVSCRQPQNTLLLDITKNQRELLESMHPKTRYNIRLAQKKGVELEEKKDVDLFFELNEETTKRDGFKSHEKDYYKKMLEYDFVHQINARFEGKGIASILIVVFGKRCVYLHGASSSEYRNVMAPYLLQWAAIQFAQALHCTEYDFWGIAPLVNTEVDANAISFHGYKWEGNHRFAGVTRFKVGFGGAVKNYPDAVEIPLEKWKYQVYRLIRKFKH